MKFFDRWKKRSFEEKMDDLSQTVLTENNIKDLLISGHHSDKT